jgi:hypothetical protein
MVAALSGALISGVAMYAVGARAQDRQVMETPAFVEAAGPTQYVPVASRYTTAAPAVVRTAAPRPAVYRAPEPRATVYREPVQESEVYEDKPSRTWGKTAMIIGGSAASGAGVGGIVGGKKGALIGAAIGGGAASIYEATKRR